MVGRGRLYAIAGRAEVKFEPDGLVHDDERQTNQVRVAMGSDYSEIGSIRIADLPTLAPIYEGHALYWISAKNH